MAPKLIAFWHWSYLIDYVSVIIVGLGAYLAETSPSAFFALLANIYYRSIHDLHHTLLGVLSAWAATQWFTEFHKRFAGRPRPYFFSQSLPVKDESISSFPSGHTSTIFTGMVFLSLYLCGKFRLFTRKGGYIWLWYITLIPIFAASLVAVSRTRDYHHNFDDIIAGCIIGVMCASMGYFLFFPSLFDARCDLPKDRHRTDQVNSDIELKGLSLPFRGGSDDDNA